MRWSPLYFLVLLFIRWVMIRNLFYGPPSRGIYHSQSLIFHSTMMHLPSKKENAFVILKLAYGSWNCRREKHRHIKNRLQTGITTLGNWYKTTCFKNNKLKHINILKKNLIKNILSQLVRHAWHDISHINQICMQW